MNAEEATGQDEGELVAVLGQQTDLGTLPEQCDAEANSGAFTFTVQ